MANSERYCVRVGSGLAGFSTVEHPTREQAEVWARDQLQNGKTQPMTIVRVTETDLVRLEANTTITETDLTATP